MAAPITTLRIGLQPDTPEEHTRLLINVNTEEAQTSLQIATDLRVRANPATAKIYYYNFDGSELLYTETIEPGGNGSWDGEPGRASTAQYEFIFNGWATEPDQVDPTEDATAGVYSSRRVYAAYKRRDISGFIAFSNINTLGIVNATKNWDGSLFYSTDASTWIEWLGDTISAGSEKRIYLRGTNNSVITGAVANAGAFKMNAERDGVTCTGNIEFLLDYESALNGTHPQMSARCFDSLFYNCTGLTSAPGLPATTLAERCYSSMFYNCTGLTSAPELPATNLANNCYESMFYGCTGLTSAPELPATTLANDCYASMFRSCRGLTSAPELPATNLATRCYSSMFRDCKGLTSAPELPATNLANKNNCYDSMFYGCTGLTSAPELPATNLASSCYLSMFYGCTGLTSAPELPATNLAYDCYASMFYGCTGLTSAPELPATNLAYACYSSMFYGCTGLTSAPELPATNLASSCYSSMFKNCNMLRTLPEFPAIILAPYCYMNAFENCTNIKIEEQESAVATIRFRIPKEGDGVDATDALSNMFGGTGGTFTGTPEINTTYYLAPPAAA